MKTTKKSELLNSLMLQIDENEYEKVKSRMKLAAKISDTLKEKGLSQKEFAKKMGKKASEISKWLSGTHNFTHDTLVDIQLALHIELINVQKDAGLFTSMKDVAVKMDVVRSETSSYRSTDKKYNKYTYDQSFNADSENPYLN